MSPEIGLLVCGSNASNTGVITAMAALKIAEKHKDVGILSLPSIANKVARQMLVAKKMSHIIVIDGCHQECAKKIADAVQIKYDAYLNLEHDLGIKKAGPFTTFDHSASAVEMVINAVEEILKKYENKN